MKLIYIEPEEEKEAKLEWYLSRKDLCKFVSQQSYFLPDCIKNIDHGAKDDENIRVYTAKGDLVCGRVIDGAEIIKHFILPKGYVYF